MSVLRYQTALSGFKPPLAPEIVNAALEQA
jgi:hypothetical protein